MWPPRKEWLHFELRKLFQQIPKQSGIQGGSGTAAHALPVVHSPGLPSPENLPDKADRDQYELLCRDNTRRPVDDYENCYLAQVPSHAVVARSVDGQEDSIWELLNQAQVLNPLASSLLSSPCLDLRHFSSFSSCHCRSLSVFRT